MKPTNESKHQGYFFPIITNTDYRKTVIEGNTLSSMFNGIGKI